MGTQEKGTLAWIKGRLKEPSTAAGAVFIASAIGYNVSPELATQVFTVAAGIIGIILMARKERPEKE